MEKNDDLNYLTKLMVIAPLLNLLSGVSTDLYAPSLPAMAHFYQISLTVMKNSITIGLIGFALGCLIIGVLVDHWGRRPVIIIGLILFMVVSFIIIFSHSVSQLLILLFIQGVVTSVASIGSRTLIVDHFKGNRFNIAMLYSSLAYGLGPVIAPFIGGVLQYYIGWRANFIAYVIFSGLLLLGFSFIVKESLPQKQPILLTKLSQAYVKMIKHPPYLMSMLILGGIIIEQFIYPTVGPFLVQQTLKKSSIVYGNSALLVGASYLISVLVNRYLINRYKRFQLINLGFILLIIAAITQQLLAWFTPLNLYTLVLPVVFISFSQGFLFANVMSESLSYFRDHAGVALSIQICCLTLVGAIGIFIVSHFHMTTLKNFVPSYTLVIVMQVAIFYGCFKKTLSAV